ncbi:MULTISPECIES: competence protein CoiA [Bhargavaea]|uniref:Competence protein CoiA n=1 Tax=Bhargavaea changchunensis TaxID=2134037 RepID=A0ABW2NL14_9BACL|nr:competence protein CoiA family protein [Bhargavaea sp. CC-171006]
MLAAILENEVQIIITQDMTRESLHQLKNTHHFRCPQCRSKMWLKIGDVRIPHFAHAARSDCRSMFSEGETPAHLAGKQQLYEMFTGLGLRTGMETALTSIGQRPDLLVEYDGRAHAIEFQCSRIPPAHVRKRTKGYEGAGIIPHWIPSTPTGWSPTGQPVRTLSIPEFLQLFIRRDAKNGNFLMTYDPVTRHFYYFVHPIHISGHTFLGKMVAIPYTLQRFPFAVPSPIDEDTFTAFMRVYSSRRRSYLKRRVLSNRKGIHDPLLRACYENRIHVDRLPPLIGVPTSGADAFKENDAEWQALFVFFAFGMESVKTIDSDLISEFLRRVPAERGDGFAAVSAYLQFLEASGITGLRDILDSRELTKSSVRYLWKEFLASRSEY